MKNTLRISSWSIFILVVTFILLTGCSVFAAPRIPEALLPPTLSTTLPAGTSPGKAASYYREQAVFFEAKAKNAEAETKHAQLAARQAWLWWIGVLGIVLGAAAFALAFAYPLASFLRIGGVAGVASGAASLLLGEALPYLGWFVLLTVVAIVASLVLNTRVLALLTQSWKSASESLAPVLRAGLDETSLSRQGTFVRPFIDKLLKKV